MISDLMEGHRFKQSLNHLLAIFGITVPNLQFKAMIVHQIILIQNVIHG